MAAKVAGMRVLVVGGAGYIGSFVHHLLCERDHETVVLDNLSTGHRGALRPDARFINGDLADPSLLRSVFERTDFDAVMHFSAKCLVAESVEHPLLYYENNVSFTMNLLRTMIQAGVRAFIFSSSAAIFGIPETTPIPEAHPSRPINPYGHSKAMVEQILLDLPPSTGFRFVSLRYFNAAGAAPDGSMGEDHDPETHLIPLVIRAALRGDYSVRIFGTDYATPDGTCIRDYVHVLDLAEAHLLALEYLLDGGASRSYNLGNGLGFSVKEVVKSAETVIGRPVPVEEAPRRPGDPPILVASSERIQSELGWRPKNPSLDQIIETAWRWHTAHPDGYDE